MSDPKTPKVRLSPMETAINQLHKLPRPLDRVFGHALDSMHIELRELRAYRDAMVAAFATSYGPETPVSDHAAELRRAINDQHTLSMIGMELLTTEHGREGSLAEAVRVLVAYRDRTEAALRDLCAQAGNSPADYEFLTPDNLRDAGLWRDTKEGAS